MANDPDVKEEVKVDVDKSLEDELFQNVVVVDPTPIIGAADLPEPR